MIKTTKNSFLKKIWLMMLAIGPGIFCIGYTIGTGSVTAMAKSGSDFGMQLLWVLCLSVLFAWVLMVAPLLIADYRNGELDTNSKQFRILTAIAAIFGLLVPIIGANPIVAQIATQVANVFVLPLVIGAIIYLVNNKDEMGDKKAGTLLNIGLICALIFSCFIAYNGIIALHELL